MRTLHVLIYDDFIEGTTAVYTSPDFNSQLALGDKVKLYAVVDSVGGTSPTLTVQLEESGDERNWDDKSATAEIDGEALSTTAVNNVTGYDDGSVPSSGFLRARIELGGTSPEANVKLWATVRGAAVGDSPGSTVAAAARRAAANNLNWLLGRLCEAVRLFG